MTDFVIRRSLQMADQLLALQPQSRWFRFIIVNVI